MTHITREQVLACTDLSRDYPWLAKWHADYRAEADRILSEAQADNELGLMTKAKEEGVRKKISAVYFILRAIERQANEIGGATLRSKENARIKQLMLENERLKEKLEKLEKSEIPK